MNYVFVTTIAVVMVLSSRESGNFSRKDKGTKSTFYFGRLYFKVYAVSVVQKWTI